jgi:hypothetical protein
MALANIHLLGGDIRRQAGTSHQHQVTFPNGRTWPIDRNVDPIPPRFLSELVATTGCSVPVIRAVLYHGEAAVSKLRLET